MPAEPAFTATSRPRNNTYVAQKEVYEKRWRWWYSAISDWMMANPGGTHTDCAKSIGRSPQTVSLVSNTDMFREFHAQRLEEWRRTHDFALAHKLTAVAEEGLDLTLAAMKKKGDQVPLQTLVAITTSSLEKLGYGVKPASPVQINNPQNVMVAVGHDALVEAREALRRVEERRALEAPMNNVIPVVPPLTLEAQASEVSEAEVRTPVPHDEMDIPSRGGADDVTSALIP